MSKPPAFQFYASDFLVDTIDLSNEELGAYVRLLCHQWVNGSLPAQLELILRCAHAVLPAFEAVWTSIQGKFTVGQDGRLRNPRMEEVRQNMVRFHESKVLAGKSRWISREQSLSAAKAEHEQSTLTSSSSSEEKKHPSIPSKRGWRTASLSASQEAAFEMFWEVFPRKAAKALAQKAFAKLDPDADLLGRMVKAVERQKQTEQWQKNGGRFIPHPATWLHQQRWQDELPSVPMLEETGRLLPRLG
jgi:uncharacterized protein YdaU (DUF1376 family)